MKAMTRTRSSPVGGGSIASRILDVRILAWLGYGFLILPSLIIVPMSFGDKDELVFPPESLSLYLYKKYFFESNWMAATYESLKVGIGSTALSVVVGVGATYALSRTEFPGRKLLTVFLLSPMFVPAIVIALGLYLYLGSVQLTGTTFGLIVGHSVVTLPFVMITTFAGLRHIDRNLETAATVMGAGRWMVLSRITLPLLRPTILVASLFSFLMSFDEIVISYFISHVQRQTLPVKMYSSITWEVSPVLAAISALLTGFSLLVCIVVAVLQKDRPNA